MTMQARMSQGDSRLYNPSRDIAHNFKEVIELVAARLEDKKWPELASLLSREDVSLDDLGEACACYCNYIASSVDKPNLPMQACMQESGFFECKPAAQVAVMAMLGTCYSGIQHAGIRDATVNKEGPMASVSDLIEAADNLRRFMGKPVWLRKLLSIYYRFKASFR